MLSNTQDIPMEAIPGCLSVGEARHLYEQMVRNPDRGLDALSRLGPAAGILMWAPFENEHLQRFLTMYEVATAQMEDPPTVVLMVPYDPYPGVDTMDLLRDIWHHPLLQRNRAHWIQAISLLAQPAHCVLTGAAGPRQVDKALAVFTLAGPGLTTEVHLSSRKPTLTIRTGPVLLLDGPSEDLIVAQRAIHQARLPGLLRVEGPLRSYATSQQAAYLVLRLYFHHDIRPLHLTTYIHHLRQCPSLSRFAVGTESLYADPVARRMEITSPEAVLLVHHMLDQVVLVSPKLALINTTHTAEEWTKVITVMHNADPLTAVTLLTWRRPHHRPQIFAAPDMLQTRATALRRNARCSLRPSQHNEYNRRLVTVTVRGPLGPDPDLLLTTFVELLQTSLGITISRGTGEFDVEPAQFWEKRDALGGWKGVMFLYLATLDETAAVHHTFEGASLQVGGTFATVSVRNPMLDANPSLLLPLPGNGQGGGQ